MGFYSLVESSEMTRNPDIQLQQQVVYASYHIMTS
jgi:hypothetical protein